MPPAKKFGNARLRNRAFRYSGFISLFLCVCLAPYYLSGRFTGLISLDAGELDDNGLVSQRIAAEQREKETLEELRGLFPKEVLEVVEHAEAGISSDSLEIKQGLLSSGVLPNRLTPLQEAEQLTANGITTVEQEDLSRDSRASETDTVSLIKPHSNGAVKTIDASVNGNLVYEGKEKVEVDDGTLVLEPPKVNQSDPAWKARKDQRLERREHRSKQLTALTESDVVALEVDAQQTNQAAEARLLPPAGVSQQQKYSVWRKDEPVDENEDQVVRVIRDQHIMAQAYISLAQQHGDSRMARELKMRLKESTKSLGDITKDSELPSNALERMRVMGQLLVKAREQHYDCTAMVKKLRALVQSAEDQARTLKKQSAYLSQLAAKMLPRGLNCLSLRLTNEYYSLPPQQQELLGKGKKLNLENKSLYHYALFSDNVLAAAVVVNSTVTNALDSSKHVFHIVTDRLNYGAMKMWFMLNPPKEATLEVSNIDDFKWLNSSYCPVLHQLETASMKEYYFQAKLGSGDGQFLKYRNPKYLSMLNHLRFYLPEVYPALDKVLFVDDDIVVQKDLTALWEVDLNGNVNGAVETCGLSFHRYDKYLNFSHPLIAENFDPQACGWAYGMNVFDLKAWRKLDMTGIYHFWQSRNEDRQLWKLGTLPPGLITFYKRTFPLDKHWHVLGLGYNPNMDTVDLDKAAVVHWNGNMKPWLDIALAKFKPYWTKYVDYDLPFLQQCNINE